MFYRGSLSAVPFLVSVSASYIIICLIRLVCAELGFTIVSRMLDVGSAECHVIVIYTICRPLLLNFGGSNIRACSNIE